MFESLFNRFGSKRRGSIDELVDSDQILNMQQAENSDSWIVDQDGNGSAESFFSKYNSLKPLLSGYNGRRNHSSRLNPAHYAQAGYTLVELLITVSIIAVLAAMLLPAVGAARLTAKNKANELRMSKVGNQITQTLVQEVTTDEDATVNELSNGGVNDESEPYADRWLNALTMRKGLDLRYDYKQLERLIHDVGKNDAISILRDPSATQLGMRSPNQYAGIQLPLYAFDHWILTDEEYKNRDSYRNADPEDYPPYRGMSYFVVLFGETTVQRGVTQTLMNGSNQINCKFSYDAIPQERVDELGIREVSIRQYLLHSGDYLPCDEDGSVLFNTQGDLWYREEADGGHYALSKIPMNTAALIMGADLRRTTKTLGMSVQKAYEEGYIGRDEVPSDLRLVYHYNPLTSGGGFQRLPDDLVPRRIFYPTN